MTPLVEALANLDETTGGDASRHDVNAARQRANFAQSEIDNDFPVLHGQAIVASWGLLEAMVEDLVVCSLADEPKYRTSDALSRVKITLGQYDSLNEEERMRYLAREYARQSSADLKKGAAAFETLLGPVGLAGALADDVRRDLFELSQVRNVLVHRSGVADRRLLESCPWLDLQVGEKIRITHGVYAVYSWAINDYVVTLLEREIVRCGHTPDHASAVMGPHHHPRPTKSPETNSDTGALPEADTAED